jgi:hypothetical protein
MERHVRRRKAGTGSDREEVLRPSLRHGRLLLLGLAGAVTLTAGFGLWRLSQGPIEANGLRPGVERWLASAVSGGRAKVGKVSVAWFGEAGSLGLRLEDVDLADGKGRPVLRAREADAGLALGSLTGFAPAPGRLAAKDFFAAVSVSSQGRYQLGYEASGPPVSTTGNLWRVFDDLTGHPAIGRPLSYLQDLDLERGSVALAQVGGPVAWTGRVTRLRLQKSGGRIAAQIDVGVGDAALDASASGLVGLKKAQVQAAVKGLVPAKVFPWAGATAMLAVLDAPVDGEGSLSWASERGVQAADVHIGAGAGTIRLSGAPTAFQSGELRAIYEPHGGQVLIQAARVSAAQAQVALQGKVWMVPESRLGGPARVQVALDGDHGLLSFSPKLPPAALDGFALRANYMPASGRLALERLQVKIAGAPLSVSGVMQRPNLPKSWGVALDGRLDGMIEARTLTALWPDEFGSEIKGWIDDHVRAGRVGQAQARVRILPGAIVSLRPLPRDDLRLSFLFQDAAIQLTSASPVIDRMHGDGLLQGDRFGMTVPTGQVAGAQLSEGSIQVTKLTGNGKRLIVRARGQGDARVMLDVVDRSLGGAARANGFDPARLSGAGVVDFSIGRSLDDGPDDYVSDYAGVVRQARVAGAAFGMALTSGEVRFAGTLQRVTAKGDAQLGPYRGPVEYEADFGGPGPLLERARFDGLVDGSVIGMSGPAGSSIAFSAAFQNQADTGHASIRSPAFNGEASWNFSKKGQIQLQGVSDAKVLRGIGAPVGAGLPDRIPVRLTLARSAGSWTGQLDADAYSGSIVFTGGASRRLRYSAQLTPAEAQRLGFKASDKATSMAVDVSMTGEDGSASYDVGPWLGQVSWTGAAGSKGQYRWRTTLSPADLHALGLPAGVEPKGPLSVDVTLASAAGAWNGQAEIAGGSFRFTASPPANGRRRLSIGGGADGAVLTNLGLVAPGMIQGPLALAASLDLGPEGLHGGHVEADLHGAAFSAPYVTWKKPAGRPMRIDVDFARTADGGWEASAIRGQGPGFGLNGSGLWRGPSGGTIRLADAKLEGAFDGSLELASDADGRRLSAHARYFDARRLIQQGGQPSASSGGGDAGATAPARPLTLDVQLGQVRVSETGLVHNLRISGGWGGEVRRPLDLSVAREDGSSLIALRLTPDPAGAAISGKVSDVGEAALAIFGQRQFRGGQATVNGRLVQGGADLHVEMTKVRLIQAPALARMLTMGSLKGMADTLNGAGIEFVKVTAPVEVRGGRLNIGRSRATGPAMGITTQGVIDIDNRTVDLSGGIAPSYALNSAMGSAPLIGPLLVPHKGEGMFGLTYSARGAFSSPKISVNPFSLAAPGILRRIFEARSAVDSPAPTGG